MIDRKPKIKNPQGVRFDVDVFDAINSLPQTSEHGFSWQVNRILRFWCELNRLIEPDVPTSASEIKKLWLEQLRNEKACPGCVLADQSEQARELHEDWCHQTGK